MHTNLEVRRRALVRAYNQYLLAERNWVNAMEDVRSLCSREFRSQTTLVGNPGSPIRRLHEQRQKALQRLKVSRLKLAIAKRRLLRRSTKPAVVYRLSYSEIDIV